MRCDSHLWKSPPFIFIGTFLDLTLEGARLWVICFSILVVYVLCSMRFCFHWECFRLWLPHVARLLSNVFFHRWLYYRASLQLGIFVIFFKYHFHVIAIANTYQSNCNSRMKIRDSGCRGIFWAVLWQCGDKWEGPAIKYLTKMAHS